VYVEYTHCGFLGMPLCRLLGGCQCCEKHTGLEVQGGSDAVCSTEMLVSMYQTIQCYNPENHAMMTLSAVKISNFINCIQPSAKK